MSLTPSDLFRPSGTVGRGKYLLLGLAGFGIKHNLDRIVATGFFGRPWGVFNYWAPFESALDPRNMPHSDAVFLLTMLATALPFVWMGVVLTLKRLRSAGLPPALVVLFFVPLLNLLFFLVLAVLPARDAAGPSAPAPPRNGFLDRLIPREPLGSAIAAILVTTVLSSLFAALSAPALAHYGFGLFVALPFSTGLFAAILNGYHAPRSLGSSLLVALMPQVLVAIVLLAVAAEGVFCLMMAAPLALGLGLMGGATGHAIQRALYASRRAPQMLAVIAIFPPAVLGGESASPPGTPLFAVRTTIEAAAPPTSVWREVVSFAELPEPTEWLFKSGIAYPLRARIDGAGVGAVRHCEFTTGEFTEPITVWDEPHRLAFSVTANPPPMQEWTPYRAVHPPHLTGFLISEGGEFLLEPADGGHTRITGTTWYRHGMWPAAYWRLWSDAVIHRIHLRVLHAVAARAEREWQGHAPEVRGSVTARID